MLTDLEFHDVIMRASGNRLGRAIVRTIHSEARASDRYKGYPGRADCEASNVGHMQIYDRILAARRGWRGRRDVGAHSGLMARPQTQAGAASLRRRRLRRRDCGPGCALCSRQVRSPKTDYC